MPKNTESSWTLARVAHVLPSLAARPRDSLAFISLRDAVCPRRRRQRQYIFPWAREGERSLCLHATKGCTTCDGVKSFNSMALCQPLFWQEYQATLYFWNMFTMSLQIRASVCLASTAERERVEGDYVNAKFCRRQDVPSFGPNDWPLVFPSCPKEI